MSGNKWLAALVAASLILICGNAFAAKPIRLGWVGPLSPPGNFAGGQEMKWAVQLMVDQINADGGVLGRPLKVFYADTRGQPAEGSASAVRLITKNKVAAIFGEFHSSVALAEIDVAHEHGIPWLGTDVWSDKITAKHYPEVFRISPANSLVYTKVAQWFVDQGFEHVAIMAENTDFGQGGAQVVADLLDEKGVDNTLVTIELKQQDFTPALLRLMTQDPRPDMLQMIVAGQAQYQLVKQACQLGFAPTVQTAMMGSSGLLQPELWEIVGDCGQNMLVVSVGVPKSQWTDETRAFIKAFKKRYDRRPTAVAMKAYDTLGVLVAAIEKAGSTDGKAIIKAMENISYAGILGTYSFSTETEPKWAYHQYMDAPVQIIQYRETGQTPAEAAIVYPEKWATSDELTPVE